MELITLEEAKAYLRVDTAEEDGVIEGLLSSAAVFCKDVARLTPEEWEAVDSAVAEEGYEDMQHTIRIAILYTLGYLYEHREKADMHELALTLRSLLFAIREGVV